ncbi:D-alanyl-D-alanine carboxypeptidase [Fodinisporobacter ferrooxydans]|uniref:serine-type D-Ala-D-Ala carboxypeptidase n=1 Tax=Fodinisporobacter ferrooxydans TaxID=2901836 RepID=A0ABY4CL41_9BACL|nr:D-alanyl-D-alanine carboxypeptidase [Alicyclobacillaceae bacterium MYW30-H2]
MKRTNTIDPIRNWVRTICLLTVCIVTLNVSFTASAHAFQLTESSQTVTDTNIEHTNQTQPNNPPALAAQSAILIDMKTGEVLYAKHPDDRHYPASITKILTAILALEHSKLSDLVTTSKLATEQDGNRIYLVEDEQETMEHMLYGLLLNSGNDAAVAIAEHVAGSVPAFADLMNEKAKQIGATHSHFVTPNGLHDPNHYTSAHDMALIARYAMQISEFRQLVATKYYPWHGKEWDSELVNLNRLLWTYDGATGIKTGYTDQAQQTAVVSATRGNSSLLAVLLDIQGLDEARKESAELLDYGFSDFQNVRLMKKGTEVTTLHVQGEPPIPAVAMNDTWYMERKAAKPEIRTHVRVFPITTPVKAGTKVGEVEFMDGQTIIARTPVAIVKDVTLSSASQSFLARDSTDTLLFALLLFLIGAGWFVRQKKRQMKFPQMTETGKRFLYRSDES